MKEFLSNDKNVVITAVLILVGISVFVVPDPTTLVGNALTGLFGVAVGKVLP